MSFKIGYLLNCLLSVDTTLVHPMSSVFLLCLNNVCGLTKINKFFVNGQV